jgi:hypothetical protein
LQVLDLFGRQRLKNRAANDRYRAWRVANRDRTGLTSVISCAAGEPRIGLQSEGRDGYFRRCVLPFE